MEKITEEQTTHNMLMELIAEECTIDTSIDIEYPPTALSLGEKTIQAKGGEITYPIGLATYGNISYITAPPKSKKSFFVSAELKNHARSYNTSGFAFQLSTPC